MLRVKPMSTDLCEELLFALGELLVFVGCYLLSVYQGGCVLCTVHLLVHLTPKSTR